MTTSSKNHRGLQNYILQDPSLKGIVSRIFTQGDSFDILSHIKSLGWDGIRDRLLAFYIHYALTKKHCEKINLDLVEDIIHLESQLRFTTVSGYSRLIQLLFYIKLDSIESGSTGIKSHPLYPCPDTIEILKKTNKRTIDIDILIIIIKHFLDFFSKEELGEFIGQGYSYESYFLKMSDDQVDILCQNMLSYGASIGESDLFTAMKI